MKKLTSFIAIALLSGSAHASFIEGENYSYDVADAFWTNYDLELDILKLDWADSLGSDRSEQASFSDVLSFTEENQGQWRWATSSEFDAIVNWFDTDAQNSGWSAGQQVGTDLFFEINGVGPKLFGTGTNGEVYNDGYDHHGYTYWQFNTLLDEGIKLTWFADFGENCPDWSVLCNSGYLDQSTPHGFTAAFAMAETSFNVAPLLVRDSADAQTPPVHRIPEPTTLLMMAAGLVGFIRYRRS